MNKKYDVVIWGASGFTGRLVCEYIYQNYTKKGSDLKKIYLAMIKSDLPA